MIGFDGADWKTIWNWANSGKLPNFKRLIDLGAFGPLESTIPPVTPPAWTSMVTGKNPGNHGIYSFARIIKTENGWKKLIYTSRNKKSKELWDYIDRTLVINVPFTYPPRRINGIMVTGMLTPSLDSEFTYPPEFRNELLEQIPDYIIELDWSKYVGKEKEFITHLYKMTKKRIELFWYLFDNKPWRLMFFVFIGPDRIQHILWGTREMEEYWKYLDGFLGEVLEKIDHETLLFIVSDHGFGKIEKTINLSLVLAKLGLIKERGSSISSVTKWLINFAKKTGLLIYFAKLYGLLPEFIKRKILESSRTQVELINPDVMYECEGAFAAVYLKRKDKRIISKLKQELYSLKDPYTNEKVIAKVYEKSEIYFGKCLDSAPDLIILPKEGYTLKNYGDLIDVAYFQNGDHRLYGIFFAYGSGIKRRYKIKNAKIYDIAPTILHIFGLPIPNDMDGRVLIEIFEEDSEFTRKKPKYVNSSYYEKKYEDEKLKKAIQKLKIKGKF
ncbi:alkaline phosphatase family protein [Thermococcus thioreducens]|uniref:alkaline phosphatase family protein n=1 Tax=Thermococcus thioreducens TaxID=277988 RepID=UPI0012FD9F58|nr:alkaline phosphatase family protein [Thermococcus thioreducens]